MTLGDGRRTEFVESPKAVKEPIALPPHSGTTDESVPAPRRFGAATSGPVRAGHRWKGLPRCNLNQSQTHKGYAAPSLQTPNAARTPGAPASLHHSLGGVTASQTLEPVRCRPGVCTELRLRLRKGVDAPCPVGRIVASRDMPLIEFVGCEAVRMTDALLDVLPKQEKTETKTGVELTNRARRKERLTSVSVSPRPSYLSKLLICSSPSSHALAIISQLHSPAQGRPHQQCLIAPSCPSRRALVLALALTLLRILSLPLIAPSLLSSSLFPAGPTPTQTQLPVAWSHRHPSGFLDTSTSKVRPSN
ncbi:hypothetical protein CORC01_12556 [Colletotrichum orchidophilum]|uniref:Uncharacterized protein n=1 Tax=Colletotrichum orchidophilum TaxID=1209926 RepID=A0A1G4AST5_9PEZI|nr:uncharacterized protein CORC01_12556 [Colletotrichum orchidophilum]OHE92153.1 hypothetical protein CORC01_12556 [Colletotrichum orchidophilum]